MAENDTTRGAPFAPPAAPPTPAAAQVAADDQRKRQADAKQAGTAKLDEEAKARADAIQDAETRQSQSKPTPTQRENDLAKLGLLDHDQKEDDGSGPELLPVTRREALAGGDKAPYRTRNVTK